MNSVRLLFDRGAGEVEKKGRKMPWREYVRSGRSAAVRTLDCRMIVRYTDGPLYRVISLLCLTDTLFLFQTVVAKAFSDI